MSNYDQISQLFTVKFRYHNSDELASIKRQATTTRNALKKMKDIVEPPFRFSSEKQVQPVLTDDELKTLTDAWGIVENIRSGLEVVQREKKRIERIRKQKEERIARKIQQVYQQTKPPKYHYAATLTEQLHLICKLSQNDAESLRNRIQREMWREKTGTLSLLELVKNDIRWDYDDAISSLKYECLGQDDWAAYLKQFQAQLKKDIPKLERDHAELFSLVRDIEKDGNMLKDIVDQAKAIGGQS